MAFTLGAGVGGAWLGRQSTPALRPDRRAPSAFVVIAGAAFLFAAGLAVARQIAASPDVDEANPRTAIPGMDAGASGACPPSLVATESTGVAVDQPRVDAAVQGSPLRVSTTMRITDPRALKLATGASSHAYRTYLVVRRVDTVEPVWVDASGGGGGSGKRPLRGESLAGSTEFEGQTCDGGYPFAMAVPGTYEIRQLVVFRSQVWSSAPSKFVLSPGS
jgi:hypothetical protein